MSSEQLERAAVVLDALAAAGGTLRYAEIQRALAGLNAASLNRLLRALVAAGILHHDAHGYRALPRVAEWSRAVMAEPTLAERLADSMAAISEQHRATVILVERQGSRVSAVSKVVHPDAPALMSVGSRFPPRLPYYGSICFLRPDREDLEAWVREQMVAVDPQVASRIEQGMRIAKRYLRTGIYRDRELWPGQCRLGVPVNRDGHTVAVLGAATLAAATDADGESALLGDLQAAVASLSINVSP